MTTFDRYLLFRFFHVFGILFSSTFGLFVVIDGFTNIDGFQEGRAGLGEMLPAMAQYYLYQSSLFFGLIAPTLNVITVMVVFALLVKNSELHPILAAGVPTYRLAIPCVLGAVIVNVLAFANQEQVIPRIAHKLEAERNNAAAAGKSEGKKVRPLYDRKTHIHISGEELLLSDGLLKKPSFVLPVPEVAAELTTIKAAAAEYVTKTDQHPAGWILRGADPTVDEIELSEFGRRHIRPLEDPADVFVESDISFEHLYNSGSHAYASMPVLLSQIRNPSYDLISVRAKKLHFHGRLTAPLVNILAVLMTIPLVVKREGVGLVANMAVCTLSLAMVFGVIQLCAYLAGANLIAADTASWCPVIATGTTAAWLTGSVQT